MRWAALVVFFSLLSTVLTAEIDDGEPFLQVMARSSVYNVGEKKAIYCKGLNLPEKIVWYSPSGNIVEGRSVKNTRVYVERPKNETLVSSLVPLIIHSTKIEDSGNWTCKAGSLSEKLEILVGEKVNLNVKEDSFIGEEMKSAKMDCIAKGYPKPVVQWYKDLVPIVDDHKKYIVRKREDNHQLEIRNLTHQDTGEYTCKVTQKALSYYTYKRVFLTVQHKPVIVNHDTNEVYYTKYSSEEVYAIVNKTKNITCSAIASPPPTFRWNRRQNGFDGDAIEDEETVLNSADGTTSVLQLRVYNETYLGEYKCSVSNDMGHVSIVFDVQLGNKPNPPDSVNFMYATASEMTFNVTCSTCNMAIEEEDKSPDPKNLTVIGYSFQLVPFQENYPADWDAATEFKVDIVWPNETLFTVGPLANKTTYHVRVSSRNAAGTSEWVEVSPNPSTSFAVKLVVSIVLLFGASVFTRCY
ncbi:neural cell adhesion molecule 2-like [Nymphalis io]|uniref:neural cell adhesion molecule 2-like n=1 Tax=Inachis io TaxID=171585 RepID=UPI0021674434|nr:neural cell adhesion molecule 2-like [Nymphalis io]